MAGGKAKVKKGKKKKGKGSDSDDGLPSTEQIKKYMEMKEGKRNKDSDSEYRWVNIRVLSVTQSQPVSTCEHMRLCVTSEYYDREQLSHIQHIPQIRATPCHDES